MRRRILLACLAILAGVSAPPFVAPAHAYFMDGTELLNHCTADVADEKFDPAVCVTYVMGTHDAFMFNRLTRNQPRCTPRTLTAGRLREVVVEFLQDHPELRAMDASALVWNAIIAEWPDCGKTVVR